MSGKLDKLIKAFRSGETRIDLDHAVLHLPNAGPIPLGVPAFITLKDRRLRLHLRASSPSQPPAEVLAAFSTGEAGQVLTSADCLSIEALTDQGAPVRLENVRPTFLREPSTFVHNVSAVTHREVAFHKLSILPMGSEGLTPAERRAENIELGVVKADAPLIAWPEDEEESVYALIPKVELKLRNAGVTQSTKHPFFDTMESMQATADALSVKRSAANTVSSKRRPGTWRSFFDENARSNKQKSLCHP